MYTNKVTTEVPRSSGAFKNPLSFSDGKGCMVLIGGYLSREPFTVSCEERAWLVSSVYGSLKTT